VNRKYLKGELEQNRGYSRAIIVEGPGKTVYLAGVGTVEGPDGRSISGNFNAQAHAAFESLQETLKELGGSLEDLVSMTVYITDWRYGPRLMEIRHTYFKDNFPTSALIGINALADPGMLIEIQSIAFIKHSK
jgi:2-iminobutanoate/2-iminopropanoate deaminase